MSTHVRFSISKIFVHHGLCTLRSVDYIVVVSSLIVCVCVAGGGVGVGVL